MTFILSDGNVVNSYGFKIDTDGIDLSRFNANPVMLADHWSSLNNVIGKWNNVRVENGKLLADAEFDMADPNAQAVAGKVERGFVKGASIGIGCDFYAPDAYSKDDDGNLVLNKCELIEASICAIPSNSGALKLYDRSTKKLLTEADIKLKLAECTEGAHFASPQITIMKKILLSQAALIALSLLDVSTPEGVDAELVNKRVLELQASNSKALADLQTKTTELSATQTALQALRDEALTAKKAAAEKMINDAIGQGKLSAAQKESWLKLALADEVLAQQTLAAIPAKKSLGGTIDNPAAPSAGITLDEFQKLSDEKQLQFKLEQPVAYAELLKAMQA